MCSGNKVPVTELRVSRTVETCQSWGVRSDVAGDGGLDNTGGPECGGDGSMCKVEGSNEGGHVLVTGSSRRS